MTNNLKLIAIATIGLSFGVTFASDEGASATAGSKDSSKIESDLIAKFKPQLDEKIADAKRAGAVARNAELAEYVDGKLEALGVGKTGDGRLSPLVTAILAEREAVATAKEDAVREAVRVAVEDLNGKFEEALGSLLAKEGDAAE